MVTYNGVPEYSSSNSNTFQIEMHFDGTIVIAYLGIDAADGLAGLSDGGGLDPDYYPSDISGMGACGPRPPTASSMAMECDGTDPAMITLLGSDDGLPSGSLDFIVLSLPEHGTLSDAGAGAITAVPYTLVGGGDTVIFDPVNSYFGLDGFTFILNDGGTPPDGGDSNIATVALEILPGAPEVAYDFPMDVDPGWSIEGDWAFGQPTGGGTHNLDPTSGHTGSAVYGYNLGGDYAANMSAPLYLTTSTLDCSELLHTELRFWRWLGVEQSSYDHASVEIWDGASWVELWHNPSGYGASVADTAWSEMVFDISAYADGVSDVQIRWGMGSTDTSVQYPGWNVDDVQIWGINIGGEPLIGDLDGDCDVDFDDLNVLLSTYGSSVGGAGYNPDADLDGDEDVDFDDLNVLLSAYGTLCS